MDSQILGSETLRDQQTPPPRKVTWDNLDNLLGCLGFEDEQKNSQIKILEKFLKKAFSAPSKREFSNFHVEQLMMGLLSAETPQTPTAKKRKERAKKEHWIKFRVEQDSAPCNFSDSAIKPGVVSSHIAEMNAPKGVRNRKESLRSQLVWYLIHGNGDSLSQLLDPKDKKSGLKHFMKLG